MLHRASDSQYDDAKFNDAWRVAALSQDATTRVMTRFECVLVVAVSTKTRAANSAWEMPLIQNARYAALRGSHRRLFDSSPKQERNLARARKTLDCGFGARGAGSIGVRPRANQAQWRIGACVARPACLDMREVASIKIIRDSGVVRTVAAFNQVKTPGFLRSLLARHVNRGFCGSGVPQSRGR